MNKKCVRPVLFENQLNYCEVGEVDDDDDDDDIATTVMAKRSFGLYK